MKDTSNVRKHGHARKPAMACPFMGRRRGIGLFGFGQLLRFLAGAAWLGLNASPASAAAESWPEGLAVTFTSWHATNPNQATDKAVLPGVTLYVPAGQSPTPFLPPGPFRATWEGMVSVELRSDPQFRVEARGTFQLEINGQTVLEFTGQGTASPLSRRVRLSKGTNAIRATLRSPADGDAFVRLFWGEEPWMIVPVPVASLSHAPADSELSEHDRLRRGRALALEYRCGHCHASGVTEGTPELAMDAPSFEGIGARRQRDWMARWILDPSALRSRARMPRLLHGAPQDNEADARAMAAYLASLTKETNAPPTDPPALRTYPHAANASNIEGLDSSANLFTKLRCQACHLEPGAPDEAQSTDKLSLAGVGAKFVPGKLAEFLQKPEAHYAWIGMPNFRLSRAEAEELAGFLLGASERTTTANQAGDSALIARGQELIQTQGCLNCHALKLENQFRAPTLAKLQHWDRGCLGETGDESPRAPRFQFEESDRTALAEFGRSGSASLTHSNLAEFAERQIRLLNCRGCHGSFDGFPALDHLGEKLKPEWMTELLQGTLAYRPRPWLQARMPSFGPRAEPLAQGLAMLNGLPPHTPKEPPPDASLADIGRQLAGKNGGFSCVSCHGVGARKATEVFDFEGVNLAYSARRLQRSFYHRWLLNPLLVDPQTKMPAFFEEDQSPLADILDGDAHRQIDALWEYLRQGDDMPAPETTIP